LFAGLSVPDGPVYGQTFSRKRFVDFQTLLLQPILPEALRRGVHTLKLILDNGTTHAPKQLRRWLDGRAQAQGWPLTIQVIWLPPDASRLDQIEIWFSVLQRKLLQPDHFNSLEELAQAIDYRFYQVQKRDSPAHQLDLHRRKTQKETRNQIMKSCT